MMKRIDEKIGMFGASSRASKWGVAVEREADRAMASGVAIDFSCDICCAYNSGEMIICRSGPNPGGKPVSDFMPCASSDFTFSDFTKSAMDGEAS